MTVGFTMGAGQRIGERFPVGRVIDNVNFDLTVRPRFVGDPLGDMEVGFKTLPELASEAHESRRIPRRFRLLQPAPQAVLQLRHFCQQVLGAQDVLVFSGELQGSR